MVKVALALLCLLLFQLAGSEDYVADIDPNDNLTEEEFEKFFHVDPADDPEEEERRAEALAKNEGYVHEINEQYIDEEIDWFDKVNEFSNLPEDEKESEKTGLLEEGDEDRFAHYGRGLIMPDIREPDERSERYFDMMRLNRNEVPSSYSSVDLGHVSPIKNQDRCGSCAAFAAAAIVETCFKKVTGVFGDYSEQHMVDCAYNADVGANGCSGAHPAAYPKWLNMTEGLLSEEDYPYQNSNPSLVCPADIEYFNQGARISDYFFTFYSDEELLKKLVYEHGAVYTGVAVLDPFFSYGGGVFAGCEPEDRYSVNHAVVVVGYGTTQDGEDYWTIKNSWGTGWGEAGFMKIKRGEDMCGVGGTVAVVMCERDSSVTLPPVPDTTPQPSTTNTPDCMDNWMWCARYKKRGWCKESHKKHKFALKNCQNTCEFCQRDSDCHDYYGKCAEYVDLGYCKKNNFKKSCMKSCGLC